MLLQKTVISDNVVSALDLIVVDNFFYFFVAGNQSIFGANHTGRYAVVNVLRKSFLAGHVREVGISLGDGFIAARHAVRQIFGILINQKELVGHCYASDVYRRVRGTARFKGAVDFGFVAVLVTVGRDVAQPGNCKCICAASFSPKPAIKRRRFVSFMPRV